VITLAGVYYVVSLTVSALMLAAVWSTKWVRGWFNPSFPGLADQSRPVGRMLGDSVIWTWGGIGVAVLVLSLGALRLVRREARSQRQAVLTPAAALAWRRVYSRRLWLCDLMVVVWAVLGAQLVWFGDGPQTYVSMAGVGRVPYALVSTVVVVGWMGTLSLAGARDPLVYGEGTAEYGKVLTASFAWAGTVAILALMLKLDVARGYILVAFPLGAAALLIARKMWRSWLLVKRVEQGLYTNRAVVVAESTEGAARVLAEFDRAPTAGYTVLGVALVEGAEDPGDIADRGLLLVRAEEAVVAMREAMADTLIVAGGSLVGNALVRRLSWELDQKTERLVVAPELLDVAGPRISLSPVAGMNLMHVDLPRFSGPAAAVKRGVDVIAAALGLAVLAVPFVVLAILIKATSRGPAFYHQTRVGLNGADFVMWKFRSMVVGADKHVELLRANGDVGNEVLFKMKDDPRVTPIGRWMRRWSVDELPQLLNVLTGSMSLVGPRPPLREEVAEYTSEQIARRFLVKPGITGLWQVSGRSDLSWEESIRLDLYYVENWSLLVDVQLLLRTVRAVSRNEGAY
jgi:exopolysaccharide biosynthesis polyprenyl glycosylphosphotransferase